MWIANSVPATAATAEHLKKELGGGGGEVEDVFVKAGNMCCWIIAKVRGEVMMRSEATRNEQC